MDDPDLDRARSEAEAGMGLAADHADRVAPGWTEDAYDFLWDFAGNHQFFISEDVSGASKLVSSFIQPPTDRAWGSVYRRAIKHRVIEKYGTGTSRRRHASICPHWRSLIYRWWEKEDPDEGRYD